MAEASGGNEMVVQVTTTITSNVDFYTAPSAGARRQDTYVYVLEYVGEGTINENSSLQNWMSTTGLAPQDLGFVDASSFMWQGHHVAMSKSNVDALYP